MEEVRGQFSVFSGQWAVGSGAVFSVQWSVVGGRWSMVDGRWSKLVFSNELTLIQPDSHAGYGMLVENEMYQDFKLRRVFLIVGIMSCEMDLVQKP